MKKVTWPVLETLDKNLDGYIDIDEFEALMNLHELLEKLEGVGVETGNMKVIRKEIFWNREKQDWRKVAYGEFVAQFVNFRVTANARIQNVCMVEEVIVDVASFFEQVGLGSGEDRRR